MNMLFRIPLLLFSFFLTSQVLATDDDRVYWLSRYASVSMPLRHVKVNSSYGQRKDPFTHKKAYHGGLDLKASYEPVMAMFPGTVESIGSDSRSGNYIIIRHGLYTVSYCHLSRRYVDKGQDVAAGDIVAISGNTGRSTAPHLHLTCKLKGNPVDPAILLKFINDIQTECLQALGISPSQQVISSEDFIRTHAPMAMEHQKRYGIPASVTLAQMAHESDFGNSTLATVGNNFFGVKATTSWLQQNKPYTLRDDDRKNEKFCCYGSVEESMQHHSEILTSKSYKKYCPPSGLDYHKWLVGIKKAGYATAPDYVKRCEKIILQYKLFLYDILATKI